MTDHEDHDGHRRQTPSFSEMLEMDTRDFDMDEFVRRLARHGAKEALHDLGIDHTFRKDMKTLIEIAPQLKEVAESWRALGWLRRVIVWVGGVAIAITGVYHLIIGFKDHG